MIHSAMRLFVLLNFIVLWARNSYGYCNSRLRQSGNSLWRTPHAGSSLDEVDLKEKPKWAAGGVVSDIVNFLINSPLYMLMKPIARQTLINTAQRNGIDWIERRASLEAQQGILDNNMKIIESVQMSYPDYYTKPFHAYDEGNLCWDAAYECESATMSMALRVWPKEDLTALEAQQRLRYSFLDAVKEYLGEVRFSPTLRMIDVGCSVGVSTHYMADAFPSASITGYDLSPHFLSVAMKRQNDEASGKYDRIMWRHGNIEQPPTEWTEESGKKFDLTAASFMFHELPAKPTERILAQMVNITKRGGVIAITDNNPRSEVIMNLPAPIFTLMKSTEPHSDEYYQFGLERALTALGCTDVKTLPTDPRHRTILARVP